MVAVVLCATTLHAQDNDPGDGNPYSGYTDTNSYFLDYSEGSFAPIPYSSGDVQVDVTVAGLTHSVDMDTGSRGFYMTSDELGSNFVISPDAYSGTIDLTSSGKVLSGMWTSETLSFGVTDQNGNQTTTTSTPYMLDVTTLGAEKNNYATYDVNTDAPGYNGYITLVNGGSVAVVDGQVTVTNSVSVNQQISYAENPGLLKSASNFGIGFDLSGPTGGTGPIGNNQNQIYNPLLNLAGMNNGTLVAGYVITATGVQLGLTTSNTGFAYTALTPTGLTSTNSQPDWQTPMGQTVTGTGAKMTTNAPGSIVMDSGISGAYIHAPGVTDEDLYEPISVFLMNSGGAVGYDIDPDDTNDFLSPTQVEFGTIDTNNPYPQSQAPWGSQYFNTGQNVFEAFDMLYDAEDGYMGIITNAYGATNPYVFFTAIPDGYVNPVPECRTTALLMLGLVLALPPVAMLRCVKRRKKLAQT